MPFFQKNSPAPLFTHFLMGCALLISSAPIRSAEDGITVSFDRKAGTATVLIPADHGHVSLKDLTVGLSLVRGGDDPLLGDLLPDQRIPVDGLPSLIAIVALNRALEPALHFATRDGGLEITLDEAAVFASTVHLRHLLLDGIGNVFGSKNDPSDYGLDLPEGWAETPVETPLHILVHGFNSSTDRMADWKKILEDRGHLAANFAYPNDQPARLSVTLFEESLRKIAEESPGRKIKVVAHSMGGLITRAIIEDPERDPGTIDQLIMLATPNQGSRLAHFAFGLEIWELAGLRDRKAKWAEEFYHAVEDGLCGAADDLKPGSRFLNGLNGRPRNPKVRYTIFAGNAAPLPTASNELLRQALKAAPDSSSAKRFFGAKLDSILKDMDEIGAETGDGVVSLSRARLAGVEDFIVFPFNHDTALEPGKVEGLTGALLSRLEE